MRSIASFQSFAAFVASRPRRRVRTMAEWLVTLDLLDEKSHDDRLLKRSRNAFGAPGLSLVGVGNDARGWKTV